MNILPDDTSYAGPDAITKKTGNGFTAGPIELQPGAKARYASTFLNTAAPGNLYLSLNSGSGQDFSFGVKVGSLARRAHKGSPLQVRGSHGHGAFG
jgi:hypothetical protein